MKNCLERLTSTYINWTLITFFSCSFLEQSCEFFMAKKYKPSISPYKIVLLHNKSRNSKLLNWLSFTSTSSYTIPPIGQPQTPIKVPFSIFQTPPENLTPKRLKFDHLSQHLAQALTAIFLRI